MSKITTHVLDTAAGRPARGVAIVLEAQQGTAFRELARGTTDDDGRLRTLLPAEAPIAAGVYRLTFDTGAYYRGRNETTFYPSVSVTFEIRDASQHYHVPLLLSPFGYSTYRGS